MRITLASDLDGTLIRNNAIELHNQDSISNLKSNGGLFIISTGRPFNGVSYLIEEYNLCVDYHVLLNGALVLDKDNNKIVHKTIPFDVVNNVLGYVDSYHPKVSLETGFNTYTLHEELSNLPYPGKKTIHNINEITNENICLISLYFDNTDLGGIDNICSFINKQFSEFCVAYRNVNYIDVVPTGCSKGDAVKLICSLENISKESLYTIGDSFNDVSMFDITDNSFTFHECEDGLKSIANNVVHSVSECINNYMLK